MIFLKWCLISYDWIESSARGIQYPLQAMLSPLQIILGQNYLDGVILARAHRSHLSRFTVGCLSQLCPSSLSYLMAYDLFLSNNSHKSRKFTWKLFFLDVLISDLYYTTDHNDWDISSYTLWAQTKSSLDGIIWSKRLQIGRLQCKWCYVVCFK